MAFPAWHHRLVCAKILYRGGISWCMQFNAMFGALLVCFVQNKSQVCVACSSSTRQKCGFCWNRVVLPSVTNSNKWHAVFLYNNDRWCHHYPAAKLIFLMWNVSQFGQHKGSLAKTTYNENMLLLICLQSYCPRTLVWYCCIKQRSYYSIMHVSHAQIIPLSLHTWWSRS